MIRSYLERVYAGRVEDFYSQVDDALLHDKKMFIITANPEIFMAASTEREVAGLLTSPNATIVPDGISVVRAMRKFGIKVKGRITGVELTEHLLQTAGREKKSVFLLGAKEDVVSALALRMKTQYPDMELRYHNGYEGDRDSIFSEVVAWKPDVIIVALGMPAQEMLIAKHLSRFQKGIFVGVGGSFDVLSGKKRRAPKFFLKTNTEWLYRIVREPSRLKRFYRYNMKFLREVKNEVRQSKS